MRSLRAVVPRSLPFAIACLWLAALAAAEPEPGRTLDDAALHRLLVSELAAALDGSRRLVPLPRNVSGVVIGPGGEPCFMVPPVHAAQQDALTAAVARAAREEPGFRVLWGTQFLGQDGDRSLVMNVGPDATVAVIEDGASRTVSLPRGRQPAQAFRLGKRWVFLTSAGIVSEGEGEAWEGSDVFTSSRWTRMLRSGDDGLVVLDMQSRQQAAGTVTRGILAGDTWTIDTLTVPDADACQTIVRLADGRWLAIGQRIAEVQGKRPQRPTEQQILQAVEAARAGDWPTLEPLLEKITAQTSNETAGLANLLQQLPDRSLALRSLTMRLESTRRDLARSQATEGLTPGQAARVSELLAACDAQLRATATGLAEAAPDVFSRSPGVIAAMLRSGMQFYRGQWIKVVEVLRQENVDSALLRVRLGDEGQGGGSMALARLEPNGNLRIVAKLSDDVMAPAHGIAGQISTLVATGEDTAYAAVGTRGLARLSAAGTTWLETGGLPAGLMQVLGVDRRGRVFLRQMVNKPRDRQMTDPGVLWVLTPDAAAAEPEPVVGWPMFGQPVVDADGSIWFLRQTVFASPTSSGGPVVPADAARPGVEIRRIEPKSAADAEQIAGQPGRPAGEQATTSRLCRLKSPTLLAEYALPLSPAVPALVAGRDAVCIEGQRGRGDAQVVVVGDSVHRGRDLHALAETAFDTLLNAAPESVLPGPWCGVLHSEAPNVGPQILRTKDLLWVNAEGRVEVYAKGRPLAVNDRLALRNVRLNAPRIIGPLRAADGRPRVLLGAMNANVEQFVWLTAGERGLEIEQAGPCPAWPESAVRDGVTDGLPLVAEDRSTVYVNHRAGRVWQLLGPQDCRPFADAGAPILAVPGGGFLAWRPLHTRSGVRVCTAGGRHDVPVLFTRHLDPVAFVANGRLLCLAPDGLALLAPDPRQGYVVETTRRLPDGFAPTSYVGRLGDADVITAIDRRQQPHVLVVRPTTSR
jgi:hypothetical protein